MATAINDFIQGLIMLGGIMRGHRGGASQASGGFLHGLWMQARSLRDQLRDGLANTPPSWGRTRCVLFCVVMLTSLGTWGLPQMVGKFYAIKNENAIKKGTVISTFFAIIVAGGCYFLGGFGRLFMHAG